MSLTQYIHRGRHMYGDRAALVYGERTSTYSQLYDEVRRCAGAFAGLEPGEGICVGILSANCDSAIVAFHGAVWAGMVPHYLNVRWSVHELGASIDDFGPAILLVDDLYLETGRQLLQRCPCIRSLIYIGDSDALPEGCCATAPFWMRPPPWRTAPAASTIWPSSTTPEAPPARARGSCTPTAAISTK